MGILSKKICPKCGSDDVEMIGSSGEMVCKKCGFTGVGFSEKEIVGRGMDEEGREVLK